MSDDEFTNLLAALAKRWGLSMGEAYSMVRAVTQADIDPLPADKLGDPFTFDRRKHCIFDNDDFVCISAEVPLPNARVDLLRAQSEWQSDVVAATAALDQRPTLEQVLLLYLNGWHWAQFWAVRHPDPAARRCWEQQAVDYGAAADRWRDRLHRRAFRVLRGEDQ